VFFKRLTERKIITLLNDAPARKELWILATGGRLQWPCGVRHETPSPVRTLESSVRIPLRFLCACVALSR
jgi:hypothetical protein